MENHCKIVEDGWRFVDYELSALLRSLKRLKPLLGSKDIQVFHDDYAHSGGPAVCFLCADEYNWRKLGAREVIAQAHAHML